MSKDGKANSMATWHLMLEEPELYIDPEELYEILIGMADTLRREQVISEAEWRNLVRKASKVLAQPG